MIDNIINKPYRVEKFNAIELSNTLRENYNKYYGLSEEDIKKFSNDGNAVINGSDFPEIYEYQNFFLLERENHFVLLDGFRRLLFYKNIPNFDINVRIYKESDLTQTELLKLLLMLNQTKFFGGIGSYFQRGFALLFKILFDINIFHIEKLFVGYLTYENALKKDTYWGERITNEKKIEMVYKRLLLPHTISDLKTLQDLSYKKPLICRDTYFGTMFFEKRIQYGDNLKFNIDDFISESENNNLFKEYEEKYLKEPVSQNGVKYTERLNTLFEQYIKYIDKYNGQEVGKSYAELLVEYKKLNDKLKKDKNLTKIISSGNGKNENDVVHKLLSYIRKKRNYNPKLYFLPKPNKNNKNAIDIKVYDNYEFKISRISLSTHMMSWNHGINFESNMPHVNVEREHILYPIDINKPSHFISGSIYNEYEVYIDFNTYTPSPIEITSYLSKDSETAKKLKLEEISDIVYKR